jgi:anti-sigma B factor antagonist
VTGVQIELVDHVPIARPLADIDAANAATVLGDLVEALSPDMSSLIVDLSDTRYVDSAGLDMLFRLGERLRDRRATLRLVIPAGSQLSRLAAIVALPHALPVHDTVGDAVRLATATSPGPAEASAQPPESG